MVDLGSGAWCAMSLQCEAALVSPGLGTAVGGADGALNTGSSWSPLSGEQSTPSLTQRSTRLLR